MLTTECINNYTAYFACKISVLSDKYLSSLNIGSECSRQYLFQLEVAITLNEILCSINLEGESCLTDAQICELIDKIKYILNAPCNC